MKFKVQAFVAPPVLGEVMEFLMSRPGVDLLACDLEAEEKAAPAPKPKSKLKKARPEGARYKGTDVMAFLREEVRNLPDEEAIQPARLNVALQRKFPGVSQSRLWAGLSKLLAEGLLIKHGPGIYRKPERRAA